MKLEIRLGRALAMCAHPYAAWRAHSSRGRLFVVCMYILASYVVVFGLLNLMS